MSTVQDYKRVLNMMKHTVKVIIIDNTMPLILCEIVCALNFTLAQITGISRAYNGMAMIPKTYTMAVAGPPIAAL